MARYDRTGPAEAEVAFVVADQWQELGIATALLYRLAAHARAQGYTTFVALTMGTNQRMLDVLRYAGFPHTTSYLEGEVAARLDITVPVHGAARAYSVGAGWRLDARAPPPHRETELAMPKSPSHTLHRRSRRPTLIPSPRSGASRRASISAAWPCAAPAGASDGGGAYGATTTAPR